MKPRLLGDIASAFGRHVVTALAGVVTVAIVVRVLGPAALGAWSIIGASAFVVGLADLGLSTPLQRSAVAADDAAARRVFRFALAVMAVTAPLFALAASWIVHGSLAGAELPEVSRATAIAVTGGLVGALAMPLRAVLLVRGGVRRAASARASGAALQLVLTVTLTPLLRNLTAPALALAAGLILEALLLVAAVRAVAPALVGPPSFALSRGELRRVVHEASAPLSMNTAVLLVQRVDVFVLAAVAPLGVVAGYAVAARACDQAGTFAKQASSALLGRFGDTRERDRAVRIGTWVLGATASSLLVSLAVLGRPVLHRWAGPVVATPEIALVLALLAAAGVIVSPCIAACSALEVTSRSPWAAARPVLAGSAVEVALTLLGARFAGTAGIAFATVVGNAVTFVLVWRAASKLLAWSPRARTRALAPAVAAALVTLGVSLGLRAHAGTALAAVVACAVAAGAGLAAAALVARQPRAGRVNTNAQPR